jgi:hypothetical protein
MIPIQIPKERLLEILNGNEATRKEALEMLRVKTGLDPDEFYPAIGNLLKAKVVFFSNYDSE